MQTSAAQEDHEGKGPKYQVDIEGEFYDWDRSTITTPEIVALGGLPADQGVIEVDLKDNTERTLGPNETVEIKPGKGFAKKVKFKRG
jgi:Multiubiquitin